MIDWKPIQEHDLEDGERALFQRNGPPPANTFLSGFYWEINTSIELDLFHENFYWKGGEYISTRSDGKITHYARINSPDAPNPIREVYEKYKYLDDYLSDDEWMPPDKLGSIAYNLWQAVKAALGIEDKP